MMSDASTMPPVAMITGGSRGLGKACVLELARLGFTVYFSYRSQQQQAEETVAAAKAVAVSPNQVIEAACVDATDKDASARWVESVLSAQGRLDVLVNNAGITRDTLAMRMKDEDWDAVIETNLNSVFRLTRDAIRPMMKQRSGRIINIASVVGVYGNAGQANYAAAKAGLIGMTKSLSKELGSRNILVNAIAPGFIQTDMTSGLNVDAFAERVSLRRMGTPEDIAQVVGFLASKGDYITGQVIVVDGGLAL